MHANCLTNGLSESIQYVARKDLYQQASKSLLVLSRLSKKGILSIRDLQYTILEPPAPLQGDGNSDYNGSHTFSQFVKMVWHFIMQMITTYLDLSGVEQPSSVTDSAVTIPI
eukprot:Gb_13310 [translate_table: standard]